MVGPDPIPAVDRCRVGRERVVDLFTRTGAVPPRTHGDHHVVGRDPGAVDVYTGRARVVEPDRGTLPHCVASVEIVVPGAGDDRRARGHTRKVWVACYPSPANGSCEGVLLLHLPNQLRVQKWPE